jgi:hypothetical protein
MSRRIRACRVALALAFALNAAYALAQAPAAPDTTAPAPRDSTAAPPATAPDTTAAPPDTVAALDRFLQGLSDSTDRRYGTVAAPIDKAGLDSSLAAALAGLEPPRARGRLYRGYGPWFSFDRAEGATWGASAYLGVRGYGRLTGQLGYAAGPNEWRGGVDWSRNWGGAGTNPSWATRIAVGRFSESLDTDGRRSLLSTVRALGWGRDALDYYLRDGVRARIERESHALRVGVGFRNQLESPQVTTTTWNLAHDPLLRIENRPATLRRIRELEIESTWRVPRIPLWLEGEARISDAALGSNSDYQRIRLAAASDVAVTRWATLVGQATWGTVFGENLPQNATYLGGWRTLRSITRGEIAASGRVFGRLELIETPDLLAWVPGTTGALLNLQLAAVVAAGGAFGTEPFTGAAYAGHDWPALHDWKSEAGIGLLYRPGLPDPRMFYRVDFTHALGPGEPGWSALFSVSTTFHLVRIID